jgi:ribosomal protein S18 acetylase RimI-like enzyme
VLQYRQFRNTDAPALMRIWNECFTGRGAVRLQRPTPLEERVFAKLYFDPAGLIIAEEDGAAVGFVHAGFGPGGDGSDLDTSSGVVCIIGVRPECRRRGIGTALLARAEEYLRQRGAATLYAGPHWPRDPFYFGLYGGSGAPGFLASDANAAPFLVKHRYLVTKRFLVWQRRLSMQLRLGDPRLVAHRQHYDLSLLPRTRNSWWNECVFDLLETSEFALHDKATQQHVARARVWEMAPFSERWGVPAAGIVELIVQPAMRRQGLGKFLLALLLRHFQDQFFEIVEIQTEEGSQGASAMVRALGFELVDTGQVYKKQD